MASLTFNLIFVLVPGVVMLLDELRPLGRVLARVSMVDHFGDAFSLGLLDSGILAWYAAATAGVLVMATRSMETRRWR